MSDDAASPTAISPADRQRACRQRKRERGEPSIPAFDSALREAVFTAYQSGQLSLDIPDLVQAVVAHTSYGDGCTGMITRSLAMMADRASSLTRGAPSMMTTS